MSSSKNPSSSPNEDDPWEQLADQFGLESGKEYGSREPAPPAADASIPASESEAHPSRPRRDDPVEDDPSMDEPPRFASEAVEPVEPEFGELMETQDSSSPGN